MAPEKRISKPSASVSALVVLFVLALGMPSALGSSVTSATFSGGAGTVSVGGILYAKNAGAMTLTVVTTSDTRCVDVTGGLTGHQQSSTPHTSWSFPFTAGTGDGVQIVTVSASPDFNPQNKCTGTTRSATASFVLDNTGPVVTGSVTPGPNGAGWHNSNVTITWTATDAGSGVASGPTPASDSVTANTAGETRTSSAADGLGNPGSGSVTVKLDKTAPAITGSRSPAANANGWNNTNITVSFTCSDALSGIKSCSGPSTLTTNGVGQSVTGTATDNADNPASMTVSDINIDKVAPTLSGTPTTSPNAAGWYHGPVTVHWTASDPLSGLAGGAPADSTIGSEGTGLTASASVSDLAGNTTTATSSPPVKIDLTPPTTTATAPSAWNNTDVTVSLSAADALSGVAATHYQLDGGAPQTGTSVQVSTEGDHTLTFWSVDNADNAETPKTVHVKIDRTPPTITHSQFPDANVNGWNNTDVTVTFVCGDALSGVASCTDPQTLTTEGKDQAVTGTAMDDAGNTATDPATVSIDKTGPTISGAPDRGPNANGWYDADIVVSFTCADTLSGIDTCPSPTTVGEGADQSVTGTAHDAADNTAEATVGDLNVDEAPPLVDGTPSVTGWVNHDVTVHWTCSDGLSGIAGDCPADAVVTGEGDDLSTSASVSDLAGNTTSTTVSGIRIDRTAPSTFVSVPDPLSSGWYANDVEVALITGPDLSGVETTYYSIDGGAPEVYAGPFHHGLTGVHTIAFWSVDQAGNVEDPSAPGHEITLKIDGDPPTIAGTRAPEANTHGWNDGPVTVTFTCSDEESGIASCPPPETLSNEGPGQSATGQALDNAGNQASITVGDINIDETPPATSASYAAEPSSGWYLAPVSVQLDAQDGLSGVDRTFYAVDGADPEIYQQPFSLGDGVHTLEFWSADRAGNQETAHTRTIRVDTIAPSIHGTADPGPNPFGWNHTDVSVSFACEDSGSGVADCTGDTTVTAEGANQVVAGSAHDHAGNAGQATVEVSIDETPPSLVGTPADPPNANGWYRDDVSIGWHADDLLSGVDPATLPVDSRIGGEGRGLSSGEVSVSDRAGNRTTASYDDVRIDRTPPVVTGAPTTQPNQAGWYDSAVTVHFGCTDPALADGSDGSGIASCSPDQTLSSDGAGQEATSDAPVDKAGNVGDAFTVTGISIDGQAPQTTADTLCTKVNDWCTGDAATVRLSAADIGPSGVKEIHFAVDGGPWQVAPGDQTDVPVDLTGSGSAHISFYAVDMADNAEVPGSASLKWDNIAPTVIHQLNPSPNADGWNRTDVTVHFIATDDGSGSGLDPSTVTPDQTIALETSGTEVEGYATDLVGNRGHDAVTVKLDRTAPDIHGAPTAPPDGDHGWYRGQVRIHFACHDALSGIASCPTDSVLTGNGAGQWVAGTATDVAGNESTADVTGIDIDAEPPTITGSRTPDANASGWNDGAVTVTFVCDDQVSGIGSCTSSQMLSAEGAGQSVTGTARDLAGNEASTTLGGINIDLTRPTISASVPPPNASGWYTQPVTITFTCGDALSGVSTCPAPVTLTDDGAAQSVTRTVSDLAGNTRSITVSGIDIDQQGPTIGSLSVTNNAIYTLGSASAPSGPPTCSASDATSGATSCSVTVTGGLPNGVGTFTFTATAQDRAGNTTVVSGSYRVVYRFDGFLQPINDTAHQVGLATSVFKGGSTVPAKLQLKRADGTVVQTNSAPQWLTPTKGSLATASVDESLYSDPATSGSTYRWDASGQLYIYNWSTKGFTTGYYYRVGVTLDDGQTYWVNIGLR